MSAPETESLAAVNKLRQHKEMHPLHTIERAARLLQDIGLTSLDLAGITVQIE